MILIGIECDRFNMFWLDLQISWIAFEIALSTTPVVGGAKRGTRIPAASGFLVRCAPVSVRGSQPRWSLTGNGGGRVIVGSLLSPLSQFQNSAQEANRSEFFQNSWWVTWLSRSFVYLFFFSFIFKLGIFPGDIFEHSGESRIDVRPPLAGYASADAHLCRRSERSWSVR